MAGQVSAAVAQTGNNPFLRGVAALSTVAGWCSAAMIVAAVGITCQMIWVRFVLNGSTVWQTEMVVYLVIAATLVGLPYVQRLRGHVNVDLVPLALPPRARRVMALVTLTLSIAVVCVMLFYGFEFWHFAWDRNWKSDTVWGVRLWIPYMAIPVGFGLFLLQLVADLVALLTGVEKPFGLADDAGLTDRGPEDASPQAEDAMAPAPDPDPAAPARAAQDFSDDKKGTR